MVAMVSPAPFASADVELDQAQPVRLRALLEQGPQLQAGQGG